MKTYSAKPHEVKRDWLLVDANDKVLREYVVSPRPIPAAVA